MRDSQKSKVYGAESAVSRLLASASTNQVRSITAYGSTLTLPDEVRFADIDSMQRYVDRLLRLPWVRQTFPRARLDVKVRPRRGYMRGHYEANNLTIAMPLEGKHTLHEVYLLHEVSHHLSTAMGEPSHGPRFAGTMLLLVQEVIGPEVGLLLGASMHEAGVKISRVNRVAHTA